MPDAHARAIAETHPPSENCPCQHPCGINFDKHQYVTFHEMLVNVQQNFSKYPVREVVELEHECPICLDPLNSSKEAIVTCCGHWYHPLCLLKSLLDSKIFSCPLCRKPVDASFFQEYEWEVMKFLKTIISSSRTAQRFHQQGMLKLEEQVQKFKSEHYSPAKCYEHHSAKELRAKRITEAKVAIESMEQLRNFSFSNAAGFQSIVERFDEHVGMHIADQFKEFLLVMPYAKDCGYVAMYGESGKGALEEESSAIMNPENSASCVAFQPEEKIGHLLELMKFMHKVHDKLLEDENAGNAHKSTILNKISTTFTSKFFYRKTNPKITPTHDVKG